MPFKDLVVINEFNDAFFKKIDEIENSILIGTNINNIAVIEKGYESLGLDLSNE